MARLSARHETLINGWAPCSVPMWSDGCPAGFCDCIAFGKQTKAYQDRFIGIDPRMARPAYCPAFACETHGGPAEHAELAVYQDGNAWCAVKRDGFTNIQECDAAFADTRQEAIDEFYRLFWLPSTSSGIQQ